MSARTQAELEGLARQTDELPERAVIIEYAAHQSWRCEHRDRFPWEPDCYCGLTRDLRAIGLPSSIAEQAGVVA